MEYFKDRYPGTPVVFDMSLVYIVVAFITVLANSLLVETFSLNSRINFGKFFLLQCSSIQLIFNVLTQNLLITIDSKLKDNTYTDILLDDGMAAEQEIY